MAPTLPLLLDPLAKVLQMLDEGLAECANEYGPDVRVLLEAGQYVTAPH